MTPLAPRPCLADLPPDILARIVEGLGPEDMQAALCGSRPFSAALRAHPSCEVARRRLRAALRQQPSIEATCSLVQNPWAHRLLDHLHRAALCGGFVAFGPAALDASAAEQLLRHLPAVPALSLRGHPIQRLPSAWGTTGQWADRLRSLDLAACGLREVPACLQRMTGLQGLNVGDNAITALPRWLWGLPRLQALMAENNELAEAHIPAGGAPALQRLFLRNNARLATWPLSPGSAPRLTTLTLAGTAVQLPARDTIPAGLCLDGSAAQAGKVVLDLLDGAGQGREVAALR